MLYTLDIETMPNEKFKEQYCGKITAPSNYKDENKIAEYIENKKQELWKKMATDIDYSVIKCIGIKPIEKEGKIVSLEELGEVLIKGTSLYLVTFGGKRFDLPIIINSGIRDGIVLPYRELFLMTKRYDTARHYDLEEMLDFGNKKYRSLDDYCELYLGVGKVDIDFESASQEDIEAHCLECLDLTEQLYKKFCGVLLEWKKIINEYM